MKNKNELVITRLFEAPFEKGREVCKREEKFTQWWGLPEGGTMPYHKMEFREGGFIPFKAKFGNTIIWGKYIFKKIRPLEELVIDDYFSDEKGILIDNNDFPKSTIILALERIGKKTKITVKHQGIGNGKHKIEEYASGWEESLNKLAEVLE